MDLSWIFLALLLTSVVIGVVKTFSRSLLRNVMRLVSIALAFSAVFALQSLGVFENAINNTVVAFDLYSYLPTEIAVAYEFIGAVISTAVSIFIIVIYFLIFLFFTRIILGCIVSMIEKRMKKKRVSEAEGASVKRKKSKNPLFFESPIKVLLSSVIGALSGALVLSVLFTPLFYVGSIAGSVTHAIDDSDATDSSIFRTVEAADKYVVTPYENSLVISLYNRVGLGDLMVRTVAMGGKIDLGNGEAVYADDVLKSTVSHAVRALAEITSLESECKHVKGDIDAIINNPIVSRMLTDTVMGLIENAEVTEPEDNDLMAKLIFDFVSYYESADISTVKEDLRALGKVVGVLAEEKVLIKIVGEGGDLGTLLEKPDTLGDVIEAISDLSSFPPVIEDAFSLGVDMMSEALKVPENDAEVYDAFIEDLLSSMVKDTDVKFDENTIKYYIYTVAKQGKKVSSSNGIKGHSVFIAYTKHWAKVQSAFAHASEDKSYGYFTMEISGQIYIYDPVKSSIVIYSEEDAEIYENYKNKISHVAGLINALSLRSRTTRITEENLNTILTAYAGSAKDATSVALANKMLLGREEFTSDAVTAEKMLMACDFSAWSDPEVRKADSRLYAGIIVDLLEVIEILNEVNGTISVDGAMELIDEFTVVGEAMDYMHETSCTSDLPALLVEALIKSDVLSAYISPDIAFKNIEIVKNHETQTYFNCMRTVAANLKFALSFAGGSTK